MIILDTDHLSVLGYPTYSHAATLIARMEESGEHDFATSWKSANGWPVTPAAPLP